MNSRPASSGGNSRRPRRRWRRRAVAMLELGLDELGEERVDLLVHQAWRCLVDLLLTRYVVGLDNGLLRKATCARPAWRSDGDVASLSIETRFRGPLVAQTSIGRLAQPCGAEDTSERKVTANEPVQRRSSPGVVVPNSACHAGGRGFESRRSRL
jgi:hypothetical protein